LVKNYKYSDHLSIKTIQMKYQDPTSEEITIKKSTYSRIIYGVIIAVSAATFVAGFQLGSSTETNSDVLTNSDFEDAIEKLETKLDNVRAVVPAGLPSQPAAPSIIKLVSISGNPIKGDPDAPVTIIEFSDFQCPFCKRFYEQTLGAIEDEYISTGKVKFVFRDLPLSSIHPNAMGAHIAAECADEQGKFWEYHDMLFEKQSEWARLGGDSYTPQLIQYATTLGLEESSFESCLSSDKILDEIKADLLAAKNLRTTGTPGFWIGNEKAGFTNLKGAKPFLDFQIEIDKLLS